MLGRYQPWHEGHRALYEEAKTRGNQVVIGVRGTGGTSSKDPLEFEAVKQYILEDVPDAFVAMMPNITHIVYGRDVGYKIEKVELGQEIEAISATQKRAEMGI
jgi:nicotinamide mononucleotide adenylyltransferase